MECRVSLQDTSTLNTMLIRLILGCQVLMAVMRKELEPGLHISRRSVEDFHRFLRVTRFFTSFVRLRVACPAAPFNLQPHGNAKFPGMLPPQSKSTTTLLPSPCFTGV